MNACTRIRVERVVKAIVVIQSIIVVTEPVTVPAAGELITRARRVAHRDFQQRGKNGEVEVDMSFFETYFGRRVASPTGPLS